MKHLKMLIPAFAVAIALLAPVTASATQLTSPAGTLYTGTIHAASEFSMSWHGPYATIKCNKSTISGTVESHSSVTTAIVKLSSVSFTECSFPFKVVKPGTLEIHTDDSAVNDGNGTITWSGMELTYETSIANCLFTTNNTDIGTLTGSDTGNAKWDIPPNTAIPRTGHSVFCGSSSTLTGSYSITTPSTLTVD